MNLAVMTWEDELAASPKLTLINEEDENDAIFTAMLLVRQEVARGSWRVTVLNSTPEAVAEEA